MNGLRKIPTTLEIAKWKVDRALLPYTDWVIAKAMQMCRGNYSRIVSENRISMDFLNRFYAVYRSELKEISDYVATEEGAIGALVKLGKDCETLKLEVELVQMRVDNFYRNIQGVLEWAQAKASHIDKSVVLPLKYVPKQIVGG